MAPQGYGVAYRTNAITRHGEHGNAVLSRWPLGLIAHHDVSDEASWTTLVADTEERFGPITVLANNAGVLRFGDIATGDLAARAPDDGPAEVQAVARAHFAHQDIDCHCAIRSLNCPL